MNYLLKVCLVALSLAISANPQLNNSADSNHGAILARQTNPAGDPATPMQKGISVELPITSNAVSVPKADKKDALVVTVSHDGSVYLGANPISTTELPANLKTALFDRAEKTVYIKADGRTPYASVVKVMDSLRIAGAEGVTLLTAQQDAGEPGSLAPPKGLEMQVVAPRPARSSANLY